MNCTNNPFPRVRVKVEQKPGGDRTDQSQAKASNINNIIASYKRTGLLPPSRKGAPQFLDHTLQSDPITMHNKMREARESFLALPEQLRLMINHDPSQLEAFLADKNNEDFLKKIGVIEEKKVPEKEPVFTAKDLESLANLIAPKEKKTN